MLILMQMLSIYLSHFCHRTPMLLIGTVSGKTILT